MKAKQAEIELEQKLLRETAELTKVHVCELGNLIASYFVLICYQHIKTRYNTKCTHACMRHLATCVHMITCGLYIWKTAVRTKV